MPKSSSWSSHPWSAQFVSECVARAGPRTLRAVTLLPHTRAEDLEDMPLWMLSAYLDAQSPQDSSKSCQSDAESPVSASSQAATEAGASQASGCASSQAFPVVPESPPSSSAGEGSQSNVVVVDLGSDSDCVELEPQETQPAPGLYRTTPTRDRSHWDPSCGGRIFDHKAIRKRLAQSFEDNPFAADDYCRYFKRPLKRRRDMSSRLL